LVIESVKLLSSSKFIGSVNIFTAKASVSGVVGLAKAIPDIGKYLKTEKMLYFTELIEKRSKINMAKWREYTQTMKLLLRVLGESQEENNVIPKEIFFPPNTQYDVISHLKKIVRTAKNSLKIIDAYAYADIISLIENCNSAVDIKILSREGQRRVNSLILEAGKYKTQYEHIEVKLETLPGTQHNRYIIIDDTTVYDIGSSINHIGDKATTVIELQTTQEKKKVIDNFTTAWESATQKI